jgi:hypothetical protein
MVKLYHGTARHFGVMIEKKGLSPLGCELLPSELRKSCVSEAGYVYFTDNLKIARVFACGTSERTVGHTGQVLEVDFKKSEIEKDPLLPDSWRYKGMIPPERLKNVEIFDCKEKGRGGDQPASNKQRG